MFCVKEKKLHFWSLTNHIRKLSQDEECRLFMAEHVMCTCFAVTRIRNLLLGKSLQKCLTERIYLEGEPGLRFTTIDPW